jgi:murein DD-endopeptidase MepM/ murein hydrolase activator NlpD
LAASKGRGWKLLVISEDESAIRQFRIPRKAVMTLVAVSVLIIIYALVETILFWTVARRAAQVEPLRRRVAELQSSSGELAKATAELTRLKSFEQQLRRVLSGKEGASLESLPGLATPFDQLPSGSEEPAPLEETESRPPSNPVGVARLVGMSGYTAMDVPTLPPVHGYVTRQFIPSRPYGQVSHHGLDIAAREGTPVLAAADGLVLFADWTYRYGNLVVIAHRSGFVSFYGHNQVLFARPGNHVAQGEPIALLGNSGVSTAPHLHFELWQDGSPVDPVTVLKASP